MAKGKTEARPTTKSETMAYIAEKTGLTASRSPASSRPSRGHGRDLRSSGSTRSRASRSQGREKPATKARKGINPSRRKR